MRCEDSLITLIIIIGAIVVTAMICVTSLKYKEMELENQPLPVNDSGIGDWQEGETK